MDMECNVWIFTIWRFASEIHLKGRQVMDKEIIINVQAEIIKEYKIQQIYFNKIFVDIIRLYKGRLDLTEAERKLFDFSWTCNDLMVDNTKLYGLLSSLDKMKKETA
jgi:hypothetical protein